MTIARRIQAPALMRQRLTDGPGSTWKAENWFLSSAWRRNSPVAARFLRRRHQRLAFVSCGGFGGGVRTPTTRPSRSVTIGSSSGGRGRRRRNMPVLFPH